MTWVGIVGMLLSLAVFPFAFVHRTGGRVAIFLLAALIHIGTAIVYYLWVKAGNTADTILYYYDPFKMMGTGLRPGTLFALYMVQTLKESIGGTYLDYFLVFQAFGLWGIAFMMRTVEEIYAELGTDQPPLTYLIFFLPGVHFWTSAIGKDAPLFFGVSLAIWAAMRLRTRIPAFAFALFVMVLFRPHIALMASVSMALAAFFDPRASGWVKVTLLMLAFAGMAVFAGTVQTSFAVDVTSADSISEFISRNNEVSKKMGGGSAVIGASYPIKLLSLLFRPLFFDAQGTFGLIASFENLFILFMMGTMVRRIGDSFRLARQVFFMRFAVVFSIIITLTLALVYYNVGLGLRQKMMIMPGLLVFFAALWGVRQVKKRSNPALSYA
jgi:hypothetical protein